jgi:hypothetical protein
MVSTSHGSRRAAQSVRMVCDNEDDAAALDRIGAVLRGRGFHAQLAIPPDGKPSLTVTNPQASALSENIRVSRGWLWWSWKERIAPVADAQDAADAITRVLAYGASST